MHIACCLANSRQAFSECEFSNMRTLLTAKTTATRENNRISAATGLEKDEKE